MLHNKFNEATCDSDGEHFATLNITGHTFTNHNHNYNYNGDTMHQQAVISIHTT